MSSNPQIIKSLIAARTATVSALRREHLSIINKLATSPSDAMLGKRLTEIERELAEVQSSISAHKDSLKLAFEIQAEERAAAAIAETEAQRVAVLDAAHRRLKSAAAVDAAAAKFIACLRDFKTESTELAADAQALVISRYHETHIRESATFNLLPAAAASSGHFGVALLGIVRQAIEILGPNATDEHFAANEFTRTAGISFTSVTGDAVETIKGTLKP